MKLGTPSNCGIPAPISDGLLKSLLSSAELLNSLESIGVAPPKPEDIEKPLLEAINQRIDACTALKDYIRAGGATKERLRKWRLQAKADQESEKCLRVYRDLYSTVLKHAAKEE